MLFQSTRQGDDTQIGKGIWRSETPINGRIERVPLECRTIELNPAFRPVEGYSTANGPGEWSDKQIKKFPESKNYQSQDQQDCSISAIWRNKYVCFQPEMVTMTLATSSHRRAWRTDQEVVFLCLNNMIGMNFTFWQSTGRRSGHHDPRDPLRDVI
jgi:hypothetical protein